jgi:hypothetical protein
VQAALTDARVGFTVDVTDDGGSVVVDLAVEAEHTSGFWLTVFHAP